MEWKCLSILAVICQLASIVHGGRIEGTPSLSEQEKNAQRASVVMCHPDQTYFCINLTHYSPCVHLDVSDLRRTPLQMIREEFYCGVERCCQVGADSHCSYRCQRSSHDFENPRLPWTFSRFKKKKQKKSRGPLTVEEVDRLNRIVSVKSFIIRQKDLDGWEDGSFEEINNGWKPSYRTFCPLKSFSNDQLFTSSIRSITFGSTELLISRTTEMVTQSTIDFKSKSTTPQLPTAITIQEEPTTEPRTEKQTRTTTKRTTTTERTTTKRTTTKQTTTKTRTTAATGPRMRCTRAVLYEKAKILGTCVDYLQCTREGRKYVWRVKTCPVDNYFSENWQFCKPMEAVPCDLKNINRN